MIRFLPLAALLAGGLLLATPSQAEVPDFIGMTTNGHWVTLIHLEGEPNYWVWSAAHWAPPAGLPITFGDGETASIAWGTKLRNGPFNDPREADGFLGRLDRPLPTTPVEVMWSRPADLQPGEETEICGWSLESGGIVEFRAPAHWRDRESSAWIDEEYEEGIWFYCPTGADNLPGDSGAPVLATCGGRFLGATVGYFSVPEDHPALPQPLPGCPEPATPGTVDGGLIHPVFWFLEEWPEAFPSFPDSGPPKIVAGPAGTITVSWPAHRRLEETRNLRDWVAAEGPIAIDGNFWTMTLPLDNGCRFWRCAPSGLP